MIVTEIQFGLMVMTHASISHYHQTRIETMIKQLEEIVLSSNKPALQTQQSPLHSTETETLRVIPTMLEKYLEQTVDEEGVVVYARYCRKKRN